MTGITLRRPPELDGAQRAAIAHLEVVRAAELLYAVGERDRVIPIVTDLAERAVDPAALLGLAEIAARHQVTPAQVVLRWHLEHGITVIPKSAHPDRIKSNFDLFTFSLTPEEVTRLDHL